MGGGASLFGRSPAESDDYFVKDNPLACHALIAPSGAASQVSANFKIGIYPIHFVCAAVDRQRSRLFQKERSRGRTYLSSACNIDAGDARERVADGDKRRLDDDRSESARRRFCHSRLMVKNLGLNYLLTRPEITRAEQLKGKKIGISRLGAAPHRILQLGWQPLSVYQSNQAQELLFTAALGA